MPKNWCFWTVVLKTLESPLDCKEIKPVIPKRISPEYSLEWLMLKLKLQYFGHLMWRADIGKDPDAGKDWRQEEKGPTEDEMVGWHHRLNGHQFEQAPGVGDGQGSLACCSPWGHKESNMTELLNWTELTVRQISSYLPDQGLKPHPLHWKHRVLTTGPPGKSQNVTLFGNKVIAD